LWAARVAGERATSRQSLRLVTVMIATVLVLMAAHIVEVVVWSFAYTMIRVAPPGTDLIYFAFVNYTTLGYGDVTPSERWHLVGPMTAMNGVLLFGWSTAVIFCSPAGRDDEPDRRRTATERGIFRVMHCGVLAARRVLAIRHCVPASNRTSDCTILYSSD
jgi:hypothetical protein